MKTMTVVLTLWVGFALTGFGSTAAFAQNNAGSSQGKELHRTWVIYESEAINPEAALEWKIGDAFRLMNSGKGKAPYRLQLLTSVTDRWNPVKKTIVLNVKGNSDNLLCGTIRASGGWSRLLAIETVSENQLNLYWPDSDECAHSESHPGHARAEN